MMECATYDGKVRNVVCLLRATHGTALQMITTDITAQRSGTIRLMTGDKLLSMDLNAEDHKTSYKCSKVWGNGKMTNGCSEVVFI